MPSTPSSRFYQIPVRGTVKLIDPITTDGIVVFRSSILNRVIPTAHCKITLFGSDNSRILTINFRPMHDEIIFNSYKVNWLTEQRVKFDGKFEGQNFTIAIYDHGDRYQILMNGRTVIYYVKQLQGDVTSLQYFAFEGEASLFSENIAVQTYTNLAALIPGSA